MSFPLCAFQVDEAWNSRGETTSYLKHKQERVFYLAQKDMSPPITLPKGMMLIRSRRKEKGQLASPRHRPVKDQMKLWELGGEERKENGNSL